MLIYPRVMKRSVPSGTEARKRVLPTEPTGTFRWVELLLWMQSHTDVYWIEMLPRDVVVMIGCLTGRVTTHAENLSIERSSLLFRSTYPSLKKEAVEMLDGVLQETWLHIGAIPFIVEQAHTDIDAMRRFSRIEPICCALPALMESGAQQLLCDAFDNVLTFRAAYAEEFLKRLLKKTSVCRSPFCLSCDGRAKKFVTADMAQKIMVHACGPSSTDFICDVAYLVKEGIVPANEKLLKDILDKTFRRHSNFGERGFHSICQIVDALDVMCKSTPSTVQCAALADTARHLMAQYTRGSLDKVTKNRVMHDINLISTVVPIAVLLMDTVETFVSLHPSRHALSNAWNILILRATVADEAKKSWPCEVMPQMVELSPVDCLDWVNAMIISGCGDMALYIISHPNVIAALLRCNAKPDLPLEQKRTVDGLFKAIRDHWHRVCDPPPVVCDSMDNSSTAAAAAANPPSGGDIVMLL